MLLKIRPPKPLAINCEIITKSRHIVRSWSRPKAWSFTKTSIRIRNNHKELSNNCLKAKTLPSILMGHLHRQFFFIRFKFLSYIHLLWGFFLSTYAVTPPLRHPVTAPELFLLVPHLKFSLLEFSREFFQFCWAVCVYLFLQSFAP